MEKNRLGFSGNHFSKETREKLHLENEILRLKLKAQTGGDLRHEGKELPPEIEHIFLKNILAFEENYAGAALISVFDYVGRPAYRDAASMTDAETEVALTELTDLLFRKNLTIDFGDLVHDRARYEFITNDLFPHQINDINVAGMFLHFQYEEFHPNHDSDIRARAMEFIADWFERTMGKFSWELSEECVFPDGTTMPKKQLLKKFELVFQSYIGFKDCQYLIREVRFEEKEEGLKGVGYVDGAVKYQAVLESGEIKYFDGPFKLFMALESGCWRISYFIFPGFEW
ncbi:MAG: hypothetical protein H7Y03_06060 [Chitinophagaceae bacterium]|nr:hypothetical protein [Chitinophagaceae bacterium]